MSFLERLRTAERKHDSLLCVGLDPDPARFPAPWTGDASRIHERSAFSRDASTS